MWATKFHYGLSAEKLIFEGNFEAIYPLHKSNQSYVSNAKKNRTNPYSLLTAFGYQLDLLQVYFFLFSIILYILTTSSQPSQQQQQQNNSDDNNGKFFLFRIKLGCIDFHIKIETEVDRFIYALWNEASV